MSETTLHGQTTFRLVGGSLSWSETPYFHKGGPYEWCQSCLCQNVKKKLFFQTATGCLKKMSFTKLSIRRSYCQLERNTYDIGGKSANAQFGKTQIF